MPDVPGFGDFIENLVLAAGMLLIAFATWTRSRVQAHSQEISNSEKLVTKLESFLDDEKIENKSLEQRLSSCLNIKTDLKLEIARRAADADVMLSQIDALIKERDELVEKYKEIIAGKNEQITKGELKIEAKDAQIEKLEAQLKHCREVEEKLSKARDSLHHSEQGRLEAETRLTQVTREIADLKQQLNIKSKLQERKDDE